MKNKIHETNKQMDNSQTIYDNRTLTSKSRKTNHNLYSNWLRMFRKVQEIQDIFRRITANSLNFYYSPFILEKAKYLP